MILQSNIDHLITHNKHIFPNHNAFMLQNLYSLWGKTKPLQGTKVLHNIPLTYETLVKLESLLVAGADLTVTQVKFVQSSPPPDIVTLLDQLEINYIESHEEIAGEFDIALDCCAEVLCMPNVKITQGIVELTQSGGAIYKNANLPIPVINVDDSNLKKLEGMYGTGESFVRAFKEISNESIQDKLFMVFGFGKVGRGIVKYLSQHTPYIVVIDKCLETVNAAKMMGYTALHNSEQERIIEFSKEAFCLVTATGEEFALSNLLNSVHCPQAYVANMGVADEIGSAFNHNKVLCQKTPINFTLKHPTLLHFIDPIFYAHNLGAQLLIENHFSKEYHAFPTYLDDLIIKLWNKYHPIDISDIYTC